jgi:enterochelin esterase-like enzyme
MLSGVNVSRRSLLAALVASVAARSARGDTPDAGDPFERRDLVEGGDATLGRRFTLFFPRGLAPGEKVPLLVLLHGLGETGDERMGVYAWLDRYGLGTAYDRLLHPPVARASARADWSATRLAEVNAMLTAQPFRGLAIACPFTPNVYKQANPSAALDRYARWIADTVVPRARAEAPVWPDPAHTAIDGCSLGGYVGLEVFLRAPEAFAAWGGVHSAIGQASAVAYAKRIAAAVARAGPRALHVETSEGDPFRTANEALSRALSERKIAHELRVLPGPHDQPWLREAGTLEMLLWHDRLPR